MQTSRTKNAEYTVFTDGGARGNPGPAAIGVVIEQNGVQLTAFGRRLGTATNNVAEYRAVIAALAWLRQHRAHGTVTCHLDSRLVVEQLNGRFKVKNPHLRQLLLEAKTYELQLGVPVFYRHVRREHNRHADQLVNRTLDQATG